MKVGVLLYNGYQELEFWYPVLRLREAGVEVVVIGVEGAEAHTSLLGYPVVPNVPLSQAQAGDFAALVIPGGKVSGIAENAAFRNFLKDAEGKGVAIAASNQAASLTKAKFAAKGTDDVPAMMKNLVKELNA